MPLYFFHLDDGEAWQDELGSELADLNQAKCHAVQFLAERICNNPRAYWRRETCEVTVADEAGILLLNLSLLATHAPAVKRLA